jgi:protein-tyrosine kinase
MAMSRIHDALIKAEQEKAAAANEQVDNSAPSKELARLFQKPLGRITNAVNSTGASSNATAEDLVGRCATSRWNPNLETMLFFNGNEESVAAEQFRTLRSSLYQIRKERGLQILLITSPLREEGKSFIAANLAQVMVRQPGTRALLIDGDLRWPRLHEFLGAPAEPGLAEYLRGDADEGSVIQRASLDGLFLIPGGKPGSNPAELIANGRLGTLVQRLAPHFSWIILDSPPTTMVSDASVMAPFCHGVLIVIRSGATPFDAVQRTRQMFSSKAVLGVVLNRIAPMAAYGYPPGPSLGRRGRV